jgi:hypothetical protein
MPVATWAAVAGKCGSPQGRLDDKDTIWPAQGHFMAMMHPDDCIALGA